MPNENHKHLIFLDCEYDYENMRQLSAIRFDKSEHGYELIGSINRFIKDKENPSYFFTRFTAISPQFLEEQGNSLAEVKEEFYSFAEKGKDTLLILHNLKCDKNVLFKNGINVDEFDTFCTFQNAKEKYKNLEGYSVEYLAELQGWFISSPHDSYHDAWALVPIFC